MILLNKYYKKKALDEARCDKKYIKCNCERVVPFEDITFLNFLDINTFDWWHYQVLDNINDTKVVKGSSKLWWIGKIPILKEIPYYTHKIFHKPQYFLLLECKYCEETEECQM